MDRESVLDFLKSHKTELKKWFHVSQLALFGSYARDEATESSDIDLLFDLEEPVSKQ